MKKVIVIATLSVLVISGQAFANGRSSKKAQPISQRRACNPTFLERMEDLNNGYHPYCRNKKKEEWDKNRRKYHYTGQESSTKTNTQDNLRQRR